MNSVVNLFLSMPEQYRDTKEHLHLEDWRSGE